MAAAGSGTIPAGRPHGRLGAWLVGFALGGFFDGILLHQILQWHHLLSGLEGEASRDLRVQVLADGLFHAAMYVVVLAGLWWLWRDRAAPGSGRRLLGDTLLGFGVWQLADILLAHWVLGLHRVRMDVPQPFLWDLAWLVLFAAVPLAIGWRLGRGAGPGAGRHGLASAGLGAVAIVAGALAALPPSGQEEGSVVVLFRAGAGPEAAFRAAAAVDGRVIWSDAAGSVSAIALGPEADTAPLYREGAWLVSRSLAAVGCAAWLRG